MVTQYVFTTPKPVNIHSFMEPADKYALKYIISFKIPAHIPHVCTKMSKILPFKDVFASPDKLYQANEKRKKHTKFIYADICE